MSSGTVVRVKFTCSEVTKRKHWDATKGNVFSAKLEPVVSGSEENKKFFAATPLGHIEVGTMNGEHFEPGKSYYVDFTEAPEL